MTPQHRGKWEPRTRTRQNVRWFTQEASWVMKHSLSYGVDR